MVRSEMLLTSETSVSTVASGGDRNQTYGEFKARKNLPHTKRVYQMVMNMLPDVTVL